MYKKVGVILALVLFLITAASAQVNVDRTAPITSVLNDTISVTLKASISEKQSAVDIIEFLPQGWEVTSWDISGYDKANVSYEYSNMRAFAGKDRSAAHWEFKNVSGEITITYNTKAVSGGIYAEFLTVWTYPSGFSSKTSLMTVLPKAGMPYCGNTICESSENIFNCPQDCPVSTEIRLLPLNLTVIVLFSVISIAIIIVVYRFRTEKEKVYVDSLKQKLALEDLRAYLKLGLRRGYQVREMIDALRGANVDVSLLEEIERSERTAKAAEEIKKLLEPKLRPIFAVPAPMKYEAEEQPDDEVIRRVKDVISDLQNDHELKQVMLKLDHNGVDTNIIKKVQKQVKKEKKVKPKKTVIPKAPKLVKAQPIIQPQPQLIPQDDDCITRLKAIITNLSKDDKDNIYKELKNLR